MDVGHRMGESGAMPSPDDSLTPGDPLRPGGDAPPPPPPPDPPPGGPRRLTRSRDDRLIGGVAGGLGRYFGIDPIMFRIGFVVASFFGGAGILAYLVLLAFVPADGPAAEQGPARSVTVAGAIVLGVLAVAILGPPIVFLGPGLLVLGVFALVGVLLWRAVGGDLGDDPGRIVGRVALAGLLALGIAGAAVGVGLVAAMGGGTIIAGLAIATGVALVATAFVGGVRWLIVPALALVLPLAVVAAADIDLDGSFGRREYRPVNVSEISRVYDVGMGELVLDLRDVDFPPGRTDVDFEVGVGRAIVVPPDDVCVTSDVSIGVGHAEVLDNENQGVDLAFAVGHAPPASDSQLHLNADIGVGGLQVERPAFVSLAPGCP
jgi:phage shock protein PspC (stress-responsive transcriptional regulator)